MDTAGIAVNSNYAYVGVGASTVDECAVGPMGSLTDCAPTGAGFLGVDGISLANGYAYIANQGSGTVSGSVSVCPVGSGGSLSPCVPSTIAPGVTPISVAVNGAQAYVNDSVIDSADDSVSNNIYLCSVGPGGALGGSCMVSNGGTTFIGAIQIAIH